MVPHTGGVTLVGVTHSRDSALRSAAVKERADAIISRLVHVRELAEMSDGSALRALYSYARSSILPSWNFVARAYPPELTEPEAERIDEEALKTLTVLISGVELSEIPERKKQQLAVIRLPTRLGGLGFTSLKAICKEAYVGSLAMVASVIRGEFPEGTLLDVNGEATPFTKPLDAAIKELQPILSQKLKRKVTRENVICGPQMPGLQSLISNARHRRDAKELHAQLSAEKDDRWALAMSVTLESNAMPEASAWLTANVGRQSMTDAQFSTAMARRIGAVLEPGPGARCAECSMPLGQQRLATHAFTCRSLAGGRTGNSYDAEYALAAAIRRSGVVEEGTRVVMHAPISNSWSKKPQIDGAPVDNVAHESDISYSSKKVPGESSTRIIDVVTATQQNATYQRPRTAVNAAEKAKTTHYHKHYVVPGGEFIPFGVDDYGCLGDHARKLVRTLAAGRESASGGGGLYTSQQRLRWLREDISLLVQKGGANLIHRYYQRCLPAQGTPASSAHAPTATPPRQARRSGRGRQARGARSSARGVA